MQRNENKEHVFSRLLSRLMESNADQKYYTESSELQQVNIVELEQLAGK